MAVRDDGMTDNENLVMSVKLKGSGHIYEACDIPSKPFGDSGRFVGVWVEGKVRMFPMSTVEYVDIFVQEKSGAFPRD